MRGDTADADRRAQRRMRTARILAAAAAMASLLTGCGGESDSDAVVEALAADLQENEAFGDATISVDDAHCAAERVVNALGAERVEQIGYTHENEAADLGMLSDDEIETVARQLIRCIDGVDDVLTATVSRGLVEDTTVGLPVNEENSQCVAQALLEGLGPERLLTVSIAGDGDPFSEAVLTEADAEIVADAFVDCVDLRPVFAERFEEEGLPSDVAACLSEQIPAENLRTLFAAEFSGRGIDPASLLAPALAACGLDEE